MLRISPSTHMLRRVMSESFILLVENQPDINGWVLGPKYIWKKLLDMQWFWFIINTTIIEGLMENRSLATQPADWTITKTKAFKVL